MSAKIIWQIEVRPAIQKDGVLAFPAFVVSSFIEIDHPEAMFSVVSEVMLRHIDDLDDADLFNPRRPDGTYFYPEFQTCSAHRRHDRRKAEPQFRQREMMKHLYALHGDDKNIVCAAYSLEEKHGRVPRRRNCHDLAPDVYAHALWSDGKRNSWLP